MTTLPRTLRSRRPGLTLVELLIVCLIIVLFIAVAAPLLRPNTADTKVREAARQLNAYFAEAKAYAAQRGRAVALVFDRSAAAGEAARSPNIITRLYLAEAPPHYSGDDLNSRVIAFPIARDPITPAPMMPPPYVTNLEPPPWYDYRINGNKPALPPPPGPTTKVPGSSPQLFEIFPPQINGAKSDWYALAFPNNSATMLNVIMASYIPRQTPQPSYRYAPFRIRFGGKGSYFDGYVKYSGPEPPVATGTFEYICWAPLGKSPPRGPTQFQIEFPPVPANDSVLEMPTGTVVDLQFSGLGINTADFAGTDTLPLMIVFSPGGDVERIYANGTFTNQVTRMHFLVGTLDRAVDAPNLPTDLSLSNLADPINQWVSVHARTGHVATADNITPTDFTNNPIAQARAFALTLDTKGGR